MCGLDSIFVVISDKSHDDEEATTTTKSIYFLLGKSFMFSSRDFVKKDFHFNPQHKKIPLTV